MKIEVLSEAVIVTLASGSKNISKALVQKLARVGLGLERFVKGEQLSGQALKARTGTGRRSVFNRLEANEAAGEVAVVVGADLRKARYMRAQDRGATLTPKNGQFLTIPLGPAKTANGVSRFTARQVITSPGSYGFTGTFFKGRVLFGKKTDLRHAKGSGAAVALFALVPSVKLKQVGYLANAIREKGQWAADEVASIAKEALE